MKFRKKKERAFFARILAKTVTLPNNFMRYLKRA